MQQPSFHRFVDRPQCLQALAKAIAVQLQQVLSAGVEAGLLLPGGSSPQALLPLLAGHSFPWSEVKLSPTDERWVPVENPKSNVQLIRHGLPAAGCLDPRMASEPEQSATAWAETLRGWLPFSAVLLGMGEDGHIASLFPGMPGLDLALDVRQPPGAVVGQAPDWPQTRLSLNLSMLLSTNWLGLLAFGDRKRELIEAVLVDSVESRSWPLHALLRQSRVLPNIFWAS